ncbi:MAG: ATP-binding protein [Candidatus Micrarchaeota archaeon]|nr:ATP-binding protein [Candidatus Micrarchaeota archaeon]MDE1847571.1 ATP-binding protein [Candidatus Micrarchaeota archaeon]MDE1864288.1 ATP-binding protein [Candidatus Micrarchaeota archaeon]
MIPEDSLREIIKSQSKSLNSYELGIPRREANIDSRLPHALIISGIRRAGKSTLLHQLSKRFANFHYLNFEDPRLSDFGLNDFEKLDELFTKEYGDYEYYLLDEIQKVEKWELFVRSRLDRKKKFIITGSNASLLSKELGTSLTGRHVDLELFPFSFKEYLLFKNKKAELPTFKGYLMDGGFPEYAKYGNSEVLQRLFIDIIQRDIVARYKLREPKVLEQMAVYLLTNIGREFSYNNLKEVFNLGSVSTVTAYISYFEDSYLLFSVPKFSFSLKKQLVNPRKIYAIDNGLARVNSVSFSSDSGRMLENMVFLGLRRKFNQIFYFSGKNECDFLVRDKNKIIMAIQTCYNLNSDNKEREFNGLVEALKEVDLSEGLILTYDQEDTFKIEKKRIIVKPVWKWLTEQ